MLELSCFNFVEAERVQSDLVESREVNMKNASMLAHDAVKK